MVPIVCMIANGELMLTLPRAPIWISSTVTEPKVKRKKIAQAMIKTGERN